MRSLRIAGLVAGLVLAAVIVTASRPASLRSTAGVTVAMSISPTGELGVTPAGRLLAGRDIKPGSPARHGASGLFVVRNQTSGSVSIGMRAKPSDALEGVLVVRVRIGGREWFQGDLGELIAGTRETYDLPPGDQRVVEVEAWVPADVRRGYQMRVTDVALLLYSRPARGAA